MTAPAIVSVGECMLELAQDRGAWQLGCAGDTCNTAVYLARLGLPVAFLSALGADPFSDEIRARLRAEGLDLSLLLVDPDRLPGLYAIRTDRRGERSFFYWRESSAARRLFELPGIEHALATARRARLLYLSGITLSIYDGPARARLIGLCEAVRSNGGQIAFDPNFRPRGWSGPAAARAAIESLAPLVSIALPTFDDDQALFGDRSADETVDRWLAAGAREVAVKLGPKGCRIAAPQQQPVTVPARAHVLARDTTGAGDAFNAGYLAARWQSLSASGAASFANHLAGEVVRYPGAIIPRVATPMLPVPAETGDDCA